MPDVNFNCLHCGQNLDAPDDMAGMEIPCPACGETVLIPDPAGEDLEEAVTSEDEKKGSTMRLDLSKTSMPPPPRARVVKIKRPGK